jgi:effector-binding domain-containing protein
MTIEVGMPIAAPATGGDGIAAIELPGGLAAVAIHRGHYEKLGDTHAAVARWIAEHGLEGASSPWEVYVTDPGETPDPADWQTEVIHPLRT